MEGFWLICWLLGLATSDICPAELNGLKKFEDESFISAGSFTLRTFFRSSMDKNNTLPGWTASPAGLVVLSAARGERTETSDLDLSAPSSGRGTASDSKQSSISRLRTRLEWESDA